MSIVKILVSGRSGSGKTTVINYIKLLASENGWEATHMKDYPILYEMFQEDRRKKGGRFAEAAYGGFRIVDYTAFDDALQELEGQIRKMEESSRLSGQDEILLIEFARSNYREALRTFSEGFLRDTYFFYIEADVDSCIHRIHKRVTSFASENRPQDHHYVPDEILRSYFNHDDWGYMAHEFKKDFGVDKEVVAYRNIGSYSDLLKQIEKFMAVVFLRETEYSEQPRNTGELEDMEQPRNTGELEDMEQTVDI